jgi:hypothetical protein
MGAIGKKPAQLQEEGNGLLPSVALSRDPLNAYLCNIPNRSKQRKILSSQPLKNPASTTLLFPPTAQVEENIKSTFREKYQAGQ